MKKTFIFLSFFLGLLFLFSCSTVKEGFESKRKNSTEEFLVEKKQPLVMPPDYGKLPEPKIKETNSTNTQIKELIVGNNSEINTENIENVSNNNFEDSLIKKIEQN